MEMMLNTLHGADDLMRAALTGVFDPRALVPDMDEQRLSALAAVAVEESLGGRWFWALTTDARRAGLARLPPSPADQLALFDTFPLVDGDALGAAIRAALSEKPTERVQHLLRLGGATGAVRGLPDGADLDANTLVQAIQMLQEAGVMLRGWAADPSKVRKLRRAVMLNQRALSQHRLLPSPFRGRRRELLALMHYVDRGEVALDPRGVVSLPKVVPPGGIGAVLVAGMGGTGKSALIEALRRRVERQSDMIFLTFDLDQTSLRAGERMALTMELLRQLGLLLPELDKPLSDIRSELRKLISTQGAERENPEAASSAVYSGLSQLGAALSSKGLSQRKLVLVFDTFEQALIVGSRRVQLIADWLLLLRDLAGVAALRVILSGRESDKIAAIDGLGLTVQGQLVLGDLGAKPGQTKLRDMFRRFGIPDLDLVPALITAYGSNPLVIEVIAAFCRNRPRTEIVELSSDPGADQRGALDAEMCQRVLYSRILNRIADPDLRALANPGLVLRRITVQMIEEVLAVPCGLPHPLPRDRAAMLYDALAHQIWLVRPALGSVGLEHVPDLRRVMLPQILSLPTAKTVATTAAAWFETRAAGRLGADFWDGLYYRALIDPDALEGVAPEVLADMSSYLGVDATDLLKKPQAQLREAAGKVLSEKEIKVLAGSARNRATLKRQARQMSDGEEKTILAEAVGQDPAQTWSTHDFSTNPDLARAVFAGAEFHSLAAAAPDLAAHILGFGPDQVRVGQETPDLAHPAWLAALATLARTADPTARARLGECLGGWLSAPEHQPSALERLIMSAPGTAPAQALARFVGMLAAMTGSPLLSPTPRFGTIDQLSALPAHTIETALDWRYEALMIGRRFVGADDSPLNVQVAAGVPVLHPVVLENLLGPATALDTSNLPRAEAKTLALLVQGKSDQLSDVTRAISILDRLTLRLAPQELPDLLRKTLFPGRLPEFHAPLRLLLADMQPGPELAKAIASVVNALPWWPRDLGPDLFRKDTVGPTLVGTLIDLIDRAGHLPDLARALASVPGVGARARDISDLIDAFCTLAQG
ncbi:MAG: ATP-binding protein [Pseudotabrizicola sp.]|uniref:ATP-binding protein n=1 Tax=Pseudotabrizicola sp. TaxID=2939647 RepID=UPI002730FD72|nr:ATP-binding protein [Pseudotabrizicola sp.]MDP2081297.1 ATP-binding protein [Pseudotabrizicola sp.]MDZ7576084.1 ATP-binding protein [Pseudotabrizicola sp.]